MAVPFGLEFRALKREERVLYVDWIELLFESVTTDEPWKEEEKWSGLLIVINPGSLWRGLKTLR